MSSPDVLSPYRLDCGHVAHLPGGTEAPRLASCGECPRTPSGVAIGLPPLRMVLHRLPRGVVG